MEGSRYELLFGNYIRRKSQIPFCLGYWQNRDTPIPIFRYRPSVSYTHLGVGVLYGKEEWLDRLPPYQGGGEMIHHVSFEKTTFKELPFKFEAGTPDYIGTTGLARALDYVNGIGLEQIAAHEHELTTYAPVSYTHLDVYKRQA